jgi:hypothetical protein
MSNAPKRTRTKKSSESVEEKTDLHVEETETKKPIVRKKVSIPDIKKDKDISNPLRQRLPIIKNKPFHGELRINEEDLKQIWTNIKKR